MSWLPDVLVYRSSILPTIMGSVSVVTLFAAAVAAVSIWWGKEVGLTNNVGESPDRFRLSWDRAECSPTLVHRCWLTAGYVPDSQKAPREQRPAVAAVESSLPKLVRIRAIRRVSRSFHDEMKLTHGGRKDFTSLINNARNLSRLIWIVVTLPPPADTPLPLSRTQLTLEKRRLIRLVVAFVMATKHHLRAEGGVHHDDLKGELRTPKGELTSRQDSCRPVWPDRASNTSANRPFPTPSPLARHQSPRGVLYIPPSLAPLHLERTRRPPWACQARQAFRTELPSALGSVHPRMRLYNRIGRKRPDPRFRDSGRT